jgi:hypothetical protein
MMELLEYLVNGRSGKRREGVAGSDGGAASAAAGVPREIAAAAAPHEFVNSGAGRARHVDIHASRRMITDWLEDHETG